MAKLWNSMIYCTSARAGQGHCKGLMLELQRCLEGVGKAKTHPKSISCPNSEQNHPRRWGKGGGKEHEQDGEQRETDARSLEEPAPKMLKICVREGEKQGK